MTTAAAMLARTADETRLSIWCCKDPISYRKVRLLSSFIVFTHEIGRPALGQTTPPQTGYGAAWMFGREQSGHHHAGLPSMRTAVQLEHFDLQLRGQRGRIGASRAGVLSSAPSAVAAR
jgi:hypothetical protein